MTLMGIYTHARREKGLVDFSPYLCVDIWLQPKATCLVCLQMETFRTSRKESRTPPLLSRRTAKISYSSRGWSKKSKHKPRHSLLQEQVYLSAPAPLYGFVIGLPRFRRRKEKTWDHVEYAGSGLQLDCWWSVPAAQEGQRDTFFLWSVNTHFTITDVIIWLRLVAY